MKQIEAKNITKIFPGVVALDDVSISFEKGRVHCIVGENGAGKSTLIKCLTGVYRAEKGDIEINGKNVQEDETLFDKVVFVPQEIDLFPFLSVAENLFIPFDKTDIKGLIKQKKLEELADPIIKEFGIHAKPSDLIKDLSVADQQLVQIARATMRKGYEAIILDEPTSSLTDDDVNRVFDVVARQRENGICVIYISHKLKEIFRIGDDITVFRNGRKIESALVADVDENWIVQKMLGKHLSEQSFFYSEKETDEEMLKVEHLYGHGFQDVSFTLHKGEILGFAGLIGAGRTEVMQAIFGSNPAYSGKVEYLGEELPLGNIAECVKRGIVYLPEDRKKLGLLPMLGVGDNISVLSLDKFVEGLNVNRNKERQETLQYAEAYGVDISAIDRKVINLSGGNQQKVIVARSMMAEPKIIILDEPTKGIDVGAKYEIYKLMKKLAEEGFGVIFVSSELNEIMQCCNRIEVMYEGRIIQEFGKEPEEESLMHALIGNTIPKE